MRNLRPWKVKELVTAAARSAGRETAAGAWYALDRVARTESELDLAALCIFDLTAPGNLILLLAPALEPTCCRFVGFNRDRAEGLLARATLALEHNVGVRVSVEDFEALDMRTLIDADEFDAAIIADNFAGERGNVLCLFA